LDIRAARAELEPQSLFASIAARDFNSFIDRATVGIVPGWIVFVSVLCLIPQFAIFAIGTLRLREATGEVLPQHEVLAAPTEANDQLDSSDDKAHYRTREKGQAASSAWQHNC
jgi:hypothetical protein